MSFVPPGPPPLIVITVSDPDASADPALAQRKNELYAESIRRAGGDPLLLSAAASEAERTDAFRRMDGLLFAGGPDVEPARYGQPMTGTEGTEPPRDALEAAAWSGAQANGAPVLGICRGFQVINVFAGGSLVQHVEDHRGAAYGAGPALMHRLAVESGSRLARVLRPTNPAGIVLRVNSYHHQAVRAADLGRGLVASAWAPGQSGPFVEGIESEDPERFVVGVQCHPERTESTPPEFDRLWRVFVDAARWTSARRSAAGAAAPRS